MLDSIKDFFVSSWEQIVDLFYIYRDFFYDLLPSPAGEFVFFLVNVVIIIIIIKALAFDAFRK